MMDQFTLSAIIFLCVLGAAVGNYACSVVYRLPRGQTPFEKKPYCGHCGTMLEPRDLFPLISFLLTRGKCRFCKGKIPVTYFVIELLCLALFISNFLVWGMSEYFLLTTALFVFVIILVFIDYNESFISNFILTLAVALAALLRTLQDHSIYPWFQGGFLCLFIAALIWQITRKGKGVLAEVPQYVWLSGLMGVVLPSPLWKTALAVACFTYAVQRIISRWKSTSAAFSIGMYAALFIAALSNH
jgi:prepilin signal peptidase PulO-like enzyme (type II secretory pathway)